MFISSPYYGQVSTPGIYCKWTIHARAWSSITVEIIEMSLGNHHDNATNICDSYVTIANKTYCDDVIEHSVDFIGKTFIIESKTQPEDYMAAFLIRLTPNNLSIAGTSNVSDISWFKQVFVQFCSSINHIDTISPVSCNTCFYLIISIYTYLCL